MNSRSTVEILGVRVYLDAMPKLDAAPSCHPAEQTPRGHSLSGMLATCAKAFGFTVEQLVSPSHSHSLVAARREFAHEARRGGYSFPEIGRALRRHHTTIMHLVETK